MTQDTLIQQLNAALSDEYSAIVQYTTYAAKVSGTERLELREFFLKEVPDEQGHASFLATKIVAFGGEPYTTVAPVPKADTNKEMLKGVLEAEKRAVATYVKLAELADSLGERGLAIQLEDLISDETGHKEEVELILRKYEV